MNDISHNFANKNPDVIANRLMERAEYRDGLQEIVIGLIILTFAGMTGLTTVFKGSFGSAASLWGMVLLMPIIGFGSQWAIKKVRQRFLVGETGYVKLKPVNRKRVGTRLAIIFGISCAVAALVAIAMVKVVIAIHRGGSAAMWGLFPPAGWVFIGMGIFGGALMIFRVRLLRYEIGGITMVAIGILLALSRVSLNAGLTILYCFAGLLALISGSVVFLHFLRQPAESGE
jgi:hypothetical protein